MKIYERSLQALLSSAPRGFAARSRVLAGLASRPNRRACSKATLFREIVTWFKLLAGGQTTQWDLEKKKR